MFVKIELDEKFRAFGVDLGHDSQSVQIEIPTTNPIEGFIEHEALQLLDGGASSFSKSFSSNGITGTLSVSDTQFPGVPVV